MADHLTGDGIIRGHSLSLLHYPIYTHLLILANLLSGHFAPNRLNVSYFEGSGTD